MISCAFEIFLNGPDICLLQVTWHPETFPAPASSPSSRPSCATQTVTAKINHAWWTQMHPKLHKNLQGARGNPIRQHRLWPLTLYSHYLSKVIFI